MISESVADQQQKEQQRLQHQDQESRHQPEQQQRQSDQNRVSGGTQLHNNHHFWKRDPIPDHQQEHHSPLGLRKSAPGRAVMKQHTFATGSISQQQHLRHNSASFESFTASCADAWDSNVENCITSVPDPPATSAAAIPVLKRPVPGTASSVRNQEKDRETASISPVVPDSDPKLTKLRKLVLEDDVTDLNQLRSMAWAGIPSELRPVTWKLLLSYLPATKSRRPQVLQRKRAEYEHLVQQYYNNKSNSDEMWRQIHIDIPRMQPLIAIFQQPLVQHMFERILYIWSIRHPASGYVQGMNDLVTPFFVTYLSEFVPGHSLADVESFDVSCLPEDILRSVEADSFWSFSKLLDSIQDNYTFAQPGIQRMVNLLSRVMSRVDANLHEHLMRNSVQYLQFAFRWMNNLLIRELPLRCIVRLWDTYLAEGAVVSLPPHSLPANNSNDGPDSSSSSSTPADVIDSNPWSVGNGTPFSHSFHLFVCAAFLRFWSKNLMREQDFQGLMLLLQNLPTFHWTEKEIRLMVADAYQLKYTFTPNHLNS